MSDAIRNAIIKLSIELQTPSTTSVNLGPIVAQQAKLSEAIKSQDIASKATAQSTNHLTGAVSAASAAIKAGSQIIDANTIESRKAGESWGEYSARVQAAIQAQAGLNETQEAGTGATNRLTMAQFRLNSANARIITSSVGVASSLALLSAGTSGSLSKVLPYAFAVQGLNGAIQHLGSLNRALAAATNASATATGGAAAKTFGLKTAVYGLAAELGPVGGIVLGVVGALAIFSAALDAQEEKQKKAQESFLATRRAIDSLNGIRTDWLSDMARSTDSLAEKQKLLRANIIDPHEVMGGLSRLHEWQNDVENKSRLGKLAQSPEEVSERVKAAQQNALSYLENQRSAVTASLANERELTQQKLSQIKSLAEIVSLRDQDLAKARETLQVESERTRSLRAAIGHLSAGEHSRLDRAIASARSGTLNKREAETLEKLGGKPGRKVAESHFERYDGGTSVKLLQVLEKIQEQQKKVFDKQPIVQRIDGAREADANSLSILQHMNDEVISMEKDTREEQLGLLRIYANEIKAIKEDMARISTGVRASRAVNNY